MNIFTWKCDVNGLLFFVNIKALQSAFVVHTKIIIKMLFFLTVDFNVRMENFEE